MYDPYLKRLVYSKYLNGVSLNEIEEYIVMNTEYEGIRIKDIDTIIDQMNSVLL